MTAGERGLGDHHDQGALPQRRTRPVSTLIAIVQITAGLVAGWYLSFGVMLAVQVAAHLAGVRPITNDLVTATGLVLWALICITVAGHRYRRRWWIAVAAFAGSTIMFTAFAAFLAIPFGASLRSLE